ncbi:MAG: DUF2318 domain-containing protein [Firmicutes bacterium]|nr:DUF2318 domain-containing protein [Bacillota bacterium]
MDKKDQFKNDRSRNKREQFVGSRGSSKSMYIAVAAAVLLVIVAGFLYAGSKNKAATGQVDPREAKYIGRYLTQGFAPAKLTEPIKYDKTIEPLDIKPEVKDGKVLINVGDVISSRMVYFEYTRPSDNQVIPMLAYIKPSGRLFTGVSLCPPCQAKKQHFESDNLLTCNSCGTKRDPETQAGISGACKLYPLDEMPHKLVGDKIEIAEADLAKWTPQPLDRPVGSE